MLHSVCLGHACLSLVEGVDLKGRSVQELAADSRGLLNFIGYAEITLKSEMKIPNNPSESQL
jgi:hypothetical protein